MRSAVRRMLCGRWMMRYGMNLLRWRKKADSQDDEWKKPFRGGTHKSGGDDL